MSVYVPDDARPPAQLPWFLGGVGSWFGAFGMQGVLFSSLLVVELGENEVRVGAAQSAMMVPSVLLILLGGAVADRTDRRRLLMALHGVASLLVLGLAVAVMGGHISYALLIGYALCMGCVQAFITPARDSMLSEVVTADVGHAVAAMNVTQWGSQAVGALAGSAARILGVGSMLGVQAFVVLLGTPAISRLAASPVRQGPVKVLSPADVTAGVREVWRSPVLLPTLLLVSAVGVLFIGPFMVVFPLMMRDVYGGGVAEIGLVNTCFPLGTILGATLIVWRGGIDRKGRAQLLSLCVGAAVLLAISRGLPLWGTLLGVGIWGSSASVFMIAGRTLFQEHASEANRGRVLSTYTLGFMGAAGVMGAPLSGLLVGQLGPLTSLAALGGAMLAVVALVAARSEIAVAR